jgi:predicted Zn-dependent protease
MGDPASDAKIGAQEHPKIVAEFGGEYRDPKVQSYVNEVGQRMAKVADGQGVTYRFTVLDSPIVNAFALPGGYVYITRGLLAYATDEAELAGVLGHEIGHVVARHSAQRQTGQMLGTLGSILLGAVLNSPDAMRLGQGVAGAALASYSRDQEYEADEIGVQYLWRAGLDPYAQSDFLLTLLNEDGLRQTIAGTNDANQGFDFFASHPNTGDRVQRAYQLASATGAKPGALPRNRDRLLAAIDGMVFGDDPAQGMIKGQDFLHPDLRIAFTVPNGFVLTNTPQMVLARDRNGAAIRFDGGQAPSGVSMADYIAGAWAREAQLSDLQTFTVNGMEAATAVTQGSANGRAVAMRLVAIRADARSVYRFMMVAPPQNAQAYSGPFRATAQSFRRLSAAEAAAIKPMRLRVVTVGPGDTVASLAARQPFPNYKEERFRVLNALAPNEALRPGVRVKTIAY